MSSDLLSEQRFVTIRFMNITYPTLEELLEAGVHYGHLASKWHPLMKPYIFTTKNRVHIIDLEKTLEALKTALDFLKNTAAAGGTILFCGTKRQGQELVRAAAIACGMPYVTKRWLGGTFTNFRTIQKTIKKLEKFNEIKTSPNFETKYTKKERLLLDREIAKTEILFAGIKTLKKLPEAIFAIDVNHDQTAVREARAVGIKVVGVIDTNVSPLKADYPIPGNDDSIKAIALIINLVAKAIQEGKSIFQNEQINPSQGS